MKSNNLRIIFSALLLTITWQSEALAQKRGSTGTILKNYQKSESDTTSSAAGQVGQVDSDNKEMAQETVDALNTFGITCPAAGTSGPALSADQLAQLNAHFSALDNIVKQLKAKPEMADSEFLAVITGLSQTPAEQFRVQDTIQGYDSEARGGTLPFLEIFRSNMIEKSQDNDGNGKIDLFDLWEKVKKENPTFTFAQRKAEFIARLAFTIEQLRAFGISDKEYQEFKENNCLGALIR